MKKGRGLTVIRPRPISDEPLLHSWIYLPNFTVACYNLKAWQNDTNSSGNQGRRYPRADQRPGCRMRPSLIFLLNGGAAKPFRGGFLLDVTRSRSSGIYHTGSLAFHKRFVIFTEATRDARGLVELEASIPTADCRAAQTPACRLQSRGVSRNHRMASPPMAEPNYALHGTLSPLTGRHHSAVL